MCRGLRLDEGHPHALCHAGTPQHTAWHCTTRTDTWQSNMPMRLIAVLGQLARLEGAVHSDALHREPPPTLSAATLLVPLTDTADDLHLRSITNKIPCGGVLAAVAALHSHLCTTLCCNAPFCLNVQPSTCILRPSARTPAMLQRSAEQPTSTCLLYTSPSPRD